MANNGRAAVDMRLSLGDSDSDLEEGSSPPSSSRSPTASPSAMLRNVALFPSESPTTTHLPIEEGKEEEDTFSSSGSSSEEGEEKYGDLVQDLRMGDQDMQQEDLERLFHGNDMFAPVPAIVVHVVNQWNVRLLSKWGCGIKIKATLQLRGTEEELVWRDSFKEVDAEHEHANDLLGSEDEDQETEKKTEEEEERDPHDVETGIRGKYPHSLHTPMQYIQSVEQCPGNAKKVILGFRSLVPGLEAHDKYANTPELIFCFSSLDQAVLACATLKNSMMRMQHKRVPEDARDLLSFAQVQAETRIEQSLQLNQALAWREAAILAQTWLHKRLHINLKAAFQFWCKVIHDTNEVEMLRDRQRWRLHAAASEDTDLQAWYHSTFHGEVYRLRGPFWYKDAVLPVYHKTSDGAYPSVAQQPLTPLEEAALAHVLCSPETTYADVAGQMYVMQAVLTPPQFTLFQHLSSQGAEIIKCPRSGRPARKLFRFSFVEGNIYLTWKGKGGNMGVDLAEVEKVVGGITTDVLQRTMQATQAHQCLSLLCAGRSVDLCLDNEEERDSWLQLLAVLVEKEARGKLPSLSPSAPLSIGGGGEGGEGEEETRLERLLHLSAIGLQSLSAEQRTAILPLLA